MSRQQDALTNTISDSLISEHGELAAKRGVPSLVWRKGQDRRLDMILRWATQNMQLEHEQPLGRILVDGCGVGMYIKALAPYGQPICGIDIEPEHLFIASKNTPAAHMQLAACEDLPYPDGCFDLILSHEVLEHVEDDSDAISEIVRTLRPGGRAIVFVPNRWHPFETHGHYWRGHYHFGNTPLINYLPNMVRDRLAPHVRAYTSAALHSLLLGHPVRILHHSQIYPGYDNIIQRRPALGKWLRRITYALERSPLMILGNSHFLVFEKSA